MACHTLQTLTGIMLISLPGNTGSGRSVHSKFHYISWISGWISNFMYRVQTTISFSIHLSYNFPTFERLWKIQNERLARKTPSMTISNTYIIYEKNISIALINSKLLCAIKICEKVLKPEFWQRFYQNGNNQFISRHHSTTW